MNDRSINRLTQVQFDMVVREWAGARGDIAWTKLFESRRGQAFVMGCLKALNNNPTDTTLEEVIACAFNFGWLCREALMEAEELERMAR